MSAQNAAYLADCFADMDPWKQVNWPAERLEAFLSGRSGDALRWVILADDVPAGAIAISAPWLHGAYLHFLGVLPGFQRSGIGGTLMGWFEKEATGHYRNLWICVSQFNEDAFRFYRSCGFGQVAELEALIIPEETELLLRKQL